MAGKKKLSEKADKRYRAKVTVGHKPDGSPIYKYASGQTKKELTAAVEELRRAYLYGVIEERKDTLFGQYAAQWYEVYKRPNISISSRKTYANILNNVIFPVLADRQIRAITAEDLQSILNANANRCASDLGYISSILKNIFTLACSQGIIDRDPAAAIKKPSAKKESRRALKEAETRAAIKVMDTHPQGFFLALLYYTGLRRGEAVGLQWQDIDLKRMTLHVRRDYDFKAKAMGDVKTPSSIRSIPIPEDLARRLIPRRGVGEALVCPDPKGKPWSNGALYYLWQDLMAAMAQAEPSIETKEVVLRHHGAKSAPAPISILTPHYFRHNYASRLYAAGVDVLAAQRIMGHANSRTTIEIYTHLSELAMEDSATAIRKAFAQDINSQPYTDAAKIF